MNCPRGQLSPGEDLPPPPRPGPALVSDITLTHSHAHTPCATPKVDSARSPASFTALPPELVLHVLAVAVANDSSPHGLLARFCRIDARCNALARPLLYAQPCLTSLDALDSFVHAIERDVDVRRLVKRVRVEGRVFVSRGYGQKVSRVLKAVGTLERLELVGIDDLRPKHLVGQGTVRHLTLLNSSFRSNSLPSPPTLAPFLSSLTHLTLANLGLPPPSTHLTDMLTLCAPTLHHLALSSLRDVDAREFRRALKVLVTDAPNLHTLMLGFLTDDQISALCLPLDDSAASTSLLPTPPASPNLSGSSSPAPRRAALSLLPSLHSLAFTLPLPTLQILLSLPPTLKRLTIRPPYARPSSPGNVFGTSRSEGLATLRRSVGGGTGRGTSCAPTPLMPTPRSVFGGAGLRRPSVSLEQLEEEEAIVLALEEMLGTEGVAEELESVRWECRALRSAEARIAEGMERRRRWRTRVTRVDGGGGNV